MHTISDFYIVPYGVFVQHGTSKTKLEENLRLISSNPLFYLQSRHVYHYASLMWEISCCLYLIYCYLSPLVLRLWDVILTATDMEEKIRHFISLH